ncbi:MAG: exodeoxyribonuclease III, partial [Thermoanaerobaculia bacterium]|nr:exodeoxyribonuclease III [Thermoanaerobaculia bacterium]
RIATWKVNGIRAREAQFTEWLDSESPDVICLQEIKAPPEKVPESICDLEGFDCYWHGEGGYSGVGLHIRRSLAPSIAFFHPGFDHETRIVCARIGNTTIVSVYVPNGGKDFAAKMDFLNQLEEFSASEIDAGRDLIVCGDMNVTRSDDDVHPKERKPKAIGQLPVERELFNGMIERRFEDLGRKFEPDNDRLYTWWAPWRNLRQRNIGWRLDYILATPGLAAKASSCVVRPEVGTSDHAPVVAEIEI